MAIKIKLSNGGIMPRKAHDVDAGFDLCTPKKVLVKAGSSAVIDTGVHIEIPVGYAGLLVSKSGLNVKHGLLSTGLIDTGYQGSIAVRLYNYSTEDYTFEPGDKISQLVIMPISVDTLVEVDDFDTVTERGTNGFGSTGRSGINNMPTEGIQEKILDFIEDNRPTDVRTDWERGCAYACDEIEELATKPLRKDKLLDFIENNRPTDAQTDWEEGCAYICDEIEKLLM